ncbi:hypothetical protein NPIL_234851 [Nephila pilipes]|uniref:Uncharacterized protein n=1 Tax=Nephila pilipes TaxID=299642 RepID=A0A8X6UN28_NEPPI|nr:hypothetical protein NPIL_234851 [Nephila pilipes]
MLSVRKDGLSDLSIADKMHDVSGFPEIATMSLTPWIQFSIYEKNCNYRGKKRDDFQLLVERRPRGWSGSCRCTPTTQWEHQRLGENIGVCWYHSRFGNRAI